MPFGPATVAPGSLLPLSDNSLPPPDAPPICGKVLASATLSTQVRGSSDHQPVVPAKRFLPPPPPPAAKNAVKSGKSSEALAEKGSQARLKILLAREARAEAKSQSLSIQKARVLQEMDRIDADAAHSAVVRRNALASLVLWNECLDYNGLEGVTI